MAYKKPADQKLTKRRVERAKANGSGWSWLGDVEVPGFGVRVYPSGTKTFAFRYRTTSGRQRMMKLGQFGELTVQEAREMARGENLKVLKGEDPRTVRERKERELHTVGDLMTGWLDDYAKVHRKRWEDDERRIEARIRPRLGSLPLEDLTPELLADHHRKVGKEAKVEANRVVETLRAAWRWAEREGRLPPHLIDPTKRVKRFREKSRDRWLRREELEALMKATDREEDPYIRAAVRLFLLTGLRKSELLSARWENVDLDRGEIRLPETKTGEPQTRLLPAPAVDILRELPRYDGNPHVFPSPKKRGAHRLDIKNQWARIRERADLEDITLHDLRRTAGSYMAQAGVPLQTIQHVLGHSHPGVTKLYARLASENERDALEALASELSGVLGTAPSTNGTDPGPEAGPDLRSRLTAILEADAGPGELADRLRELAAAVEGG